MYDKGHIHHMEVNGVFVEEAYSGLAKKVDVTRIKRVCIRAEYHCVVNDD